MFSLKVETRNAAFDDDALEIAHILRETALRVEVGAKSGAIKDTNGNTVGTFELELEER